MSTLRIHKYGETVLKRKCIHVKNVTPEIRKLVSDMFETMYLAPGVGLAASQVGVLVRLCVIDVRPDGNKQPLALINPRIVYEQGKIEEDEGCLSLPGLLAKVKRYQKVRVEAINENGFPISVEGEGLLSRALQHEIDHLDGKVFIDYLSFFKRRKIESEIKKRRKQGDW